MSHSSFMPARVASALSLGILAAASTASAQVAQRPALCSPSHVWTFDEGQGATVAHDSVGGVDGIGGADALWVTGEAPWLGGAHDRVVTLFPVAGVDDPSAYVDFGAGVGAFGASDFTIMHDFAVGYSAGPLGDVIGNRTSYGHGNFFAVRLRSDGILSVEVDQDEYGTGYVGILGAGKPVNDGKLHHLAYVRQGGTLSLYVDGVLSASGQTATGEPTWISGASSLRIGHRAPFDFTAIPGFYDDLQIYGCALGPDQIQASAAASL